MRGLNWQKVEYPFARGLNQKADARLVDAPDLVRAVDVEFDDSGGLQLRKPYASIGANIFGGGTISNCRRMYAVGDELILFTRDSLYSWSPQRAAWVARGTHLATKIEEKPILVGPAEQTECDRAELSGTIVFAWVQSAQVYAAAIDKTTGAVLVAPTAITAGTGKPRIVALTTKLLLFVVASGSLVVRAIDPADPATGFATSGTNFVSSAVYDVEKIPSADTAICVAQRSPTTSYEIAKITAALSVTASTKARTCDGPISVACTTDGATALVSRGNGFNVQGDLITISSLADGTTGIAIGTSGAVTLNQITAVFTSATVAHVWWHSGESTSATDWDTDYNTVTSGTPGTAARFLRRLALVSRAFAYNGQAYVWLAFVGESSFSGANPSAFRAQLQNSNFLYRHDGFLVGKSAWHRAGGLVATGWLPGVALTSGANVFSWCAHTRRVIQAGINQTAFSNRDPLDVTFEFDSNEARRVAKLGNTVYIAGGSEVLQFDGRGLYEVNYHLYPHYFGAIEVGTGSLADGTYTYKVIRRWDNARGERDRSTTATHGTVTIAGGPNGVNLPTWTPLYVTHKANITAEVWRSQVNAGDPFYLTTSPDPAATTNPNRYVEDDPTASTNASFNDEFADATLTTKDLDWENGELENMAPPAATIIVANDSRLFIAGIPGDPHRVWYSKQRVDGRVSAFHETLTVPVPETGGPITGLGFVGETLVVFRETAVYALDGVGYDNTGGGLNYQARQVSIDAGAVVHESIVTLPVGLLFKSNKGWYSLNRGWQLSFVGAGVADYDSESVYASHIVESQHQVRIVTSGRVLVFDYLANAWAEWSITGGLHACVFGGIYHYLATATVNAEQASYSTASYGMDVELLAHTNGLQGAQRVRAIIVLGEYRSAHTLRARIGSYTEGVYFDDRTWTPSPTTVGGEFEMLHGPSQQQHQAYRIRLTSSPGGTPGEQIKLSSLTLEVGIKPGAFRQLPAAQRQ